MSFDKEEYKNYMRIKQYRFNEIDEWIASKYGDKLTFNEVTELRLIAIRQILIKYNVEVITDISWGKGLLEYRKLWEEMMLDTIKTRERNE